MKIPDKAYFDFSGGIRRDKSPILLKDNEIQSGKNFDIDEQGRIVKRRGMQAFGNITNNIFNMATFYDANQAGTGYIGVYAADTSNNVFILAPTNLTTAVTAGQTSSITSDEAIQNATSTFEMEGDIINYGGTSGGTTILTPSNVTSAHAVGAPIHQWQAGTGLTSTAIGVYFSTLNDNILLNGSDVYNEDTASDATFANAATTPVVVFLTTYKTRVYGAGNGTSAGQTTRVFYSALNDGTTWTVASDYFDVEDSRNEPITGLKSYNGNLIIYKPNSTHVYNLSSLRQVNSQVGAYNHFCPQEINGLIYTFCPSGIYITDGESSKSIGEPVKEYWKNFIPTYSGTNNRIVTNCSAGRYKHLYLLYVGDVTLDDASTLSDVVLVYNTINKSWTVYDGFTDLINFFPIDIYEDNNSQIQLRSSLFFGSTSLGIFQVFENRTLDGASTLRGSDFTSDMFRDTGTPITMNLKTKPYDLGYPNYRKQFGYLKVFTERPGVHLSYQIDGNDPKPLGLVNKKITRFQFPPDAKGYRCTILIDESSTVAPVIYNGHIFEECVALDKNVS
ncbi:MAG: hypothetical protein AAB922_06100 [Patescibacteria group bacterium]